MTENQRQLREDRAPRERSLLMEKLLGDAKLLGVDALDVELASTPLVPLVDESFESDLGMARR